MAARFPAPWLEELREKSDIVQVISSYMSLRKNGKTYWGLCPFHGEKTASFSVDGEKQFYYCFGCKAGGSVINFVMEMEHISFHEAVEHLAERAHMRLPRLQNEEDYERKRSQRERLYAANRDAARFYHDRLYQPEGAMSLAYLKNRGLSDGIIKKFGLGAAAGPSDALTRFMLDKGYTADELILAGLCVSREAEPASGDRPALPKRQYDMFRNRAIFPIIDQYGNVLAFGGRILGDGQPKYLNTSDTPVFNKRKGVFAANLLKKERKLDRVILVEGYMDVVSLTQFGIRGVCATLGTALTNDQARLLHRFAPEVFLGYDGDSAGQHAILRGLDILRDENVPARVLDFPDGLDPDEFIRQRGPDAFAKLAAITPETYRIRRLKDGMDLSEAEGKIRFAREAAAIIAPLDPVSREVHLRDLELQTGFPREVLTEQLSHAGVNLPERTTGSGAMTSTTPVPPKRPRADHTRSSPGDILKSEMLKAQEYLIGLLTTRLLPEDLVVEEDFYDPELKLIYGALMNGESAPSLIEKAADDESRSRLARIFRSPPSAGPDELVRMAQDTLKSLRICTARLRMDEIMAEIKTCADPETKAGLLAEWQHLSKVSQS